MKRQQPECSTVGVDWACARGVQVFRFRSGVTLDTGTDCRSRARSCIETCVAYLSTAISPRRRQSSKQPCSAVYSAEVPHFRTPVNGGYKDVRKKPSHHFSPSHQFIRFPINCNAVSLCLAWIFLKFRPKMYWGNLILRFYRISDISTIFGQLHACGPYINNCKKT